MNCPPFPVGIRSLDDLACTRASCCHFQRCRFPYGPMTLLVVAFRFPHVVGHLLRHPSRFGQVALAFGQLVHHIFHTRGREEVRRMLKIVGIATPPGATGDFLRRTVSFPSPRNFFVIASTVPVLLSTALARYLLPILRVSSLESPNQPVRETETLV